MCVYGHDTQAPLPTLVLNDPWSQAVQSGGVPAAVPPAPQYPAIQLQEVMALPATLVVRAGQALHELVEALKSPATHATQDVLPSVAAIVPAEHGVQVLVFPPPAMLIDPMGQTLHDALPAVAYSPASQF